MAFFALASCIPFLAVTARAQAPERQAPIEVTTPKAPAPITMDGKTVLVYELHVTNFGARPLAVQSVDVFSSVAAGQPIVTLRDSSLRAVFQAVGESMQMSNMHEARDASAGRTPRIQAGQRAVIYLWLEFGTPEKTPPFLRHRLTFIALDSIGQPASSVSSVIDSLITPVVGGDAATIATPMRGGDWLAGDGPANASSHRRSLIPLNGKAWISQRFAIDWVKVGPNGNTWHDDRSRNENFWGFGEPVLAVADGDVATASDSIADNIPGKLPLQPTVTSISGNHVILRVGKSRYVMYGHLKHGSVRVHAGQHVKRGDVIGLLGNSGQATAPHLHFQVMDAPSDLAAEGVPFAFEQFTFLGLGRDYEQDKHPTVPRRHELPIGDAVIHFPDRDKR